MTVTNGQPSNQHEIVLGSPTPGRSPWAQQAYIEGAAAQRAGGDIEVLNPPFNPQDPDASTFRWSPIRGETAAVDTPSATAEAHPAGVDMTRLSDTETWRALAREDQAAAVAGVDAEQLHN